MVKIFIGIEIDHNHELIPFLELYQYLIQCHVIKDFIILLILSSFHEILYYFDFFFRKIEFLFNTFLLFIWRLLKQITFLILFHFTHIKGSIINKLRKKLIHFLDQGELTINPIFIQIERINIVFWNLRVIFLFLKRFKDKNKKQWPKKTHY